MKAARRDDKRLFAGLLFLMIGLPASWIASGYTIYGEDGLGPGAFTLGISLSLSLVGLIETVQGLRSAERIAVHFEEWRPLILLTLSVVGFGMLAEPAGLLVAIGWTVICSCLSTPRFSVLGVVVMLIVLMAACSAIMVFGLGWSFWQLLPK